MPCKCKQRRAAKMAAQQKPVAPKPEEQKENEKD